MTKFAVIDFPSQHQGVARIEGAVSHLRRSATRFDPTRNGASLLLAALVAALLVVANEMVDTWGDGHLLAGWMLMWLIAFVGMALLAAPARRAAALLHGAVRSWSDARQRAAEDERTWNAALHDARIMADLSRAMNGIAVEDMRRYR
ncbi:hypothetical protein ALDI51_01110 [Alicycliphilus denitrificans]|jgi:hypothetical protein|uniref:Uncharacterized protein n=1 Tax=Alicycliphilus denitrificans TaxID=179636 RepID=A0A3R7F1S6_9BURK|nr:hypothetical protein [Alicycliphilus denitrificans]MBN9573204.1 hypothetical protein [Alicycliphilus denitrificans]OJW90783.1 MAG: hypothetical protein BGO66_01475 [Alicycliphilus sp. 69-12]RKJ99312.1 hypothetical protein CE154_006095 [Alicycliphilus denitrificans]BCN36792.1 hypothetical protein ALDI51_01110 [Alicycliphilus denitrificans]